MKQLISAKLWNENDGIYENRFWNGEFSRRLSPTSFYPLFAGIATQKQAELMVKEHILNPEEFWGTYVIPSISRNDPAFPDQFYWRGSIWGLTNYMVYQGLKRYRFDSTAFQFARKSFDLFMDDWRLNQHNNELYLASGGRGKGDPHYTFGALLPLVATEEYIDENPWDGLRFGVLSPPSVGEFRRAIWEGHTYEITIGPQRTALVRDGHLRFEADAGVVVRKYQTETSHLSFSFTCERAVRVTTAEFASGDLHWKIDGKTAGKVSVSGGRISFDVPAGEHSVELSKD
jgi:mannosylglycerate hydrolase MGH1-like protein